MKKTLLLVAASTLSLSISSVLYAEDVEKQQNVVEKGVIEKNVSVEGIDAILKHNLVRDKDQIIPLRDKTTTVERLKHHNTHH
jgi:hypothetical protein